MGINIYAGCRLCTDKNDDDDDGARWQAAHCDRRCGNMRRDLGGEGDGFVVHGFTDELCRMEWFFLCVNDVRPYGEISLKLWRDENVNVILIRACREVVMFGKLYNFDAKKRMDLNHVDIIAQWFVESILEIALIWNYSVFTQLHTK